MATRTTSWLSWTSLARTLVEHARLAVRLLRDPAIPLALKALPIAAVAYVVSPLDFIPDVLPVLGQLDDVGLLLLALQSFVRWCPPAAVDHHRSAINQGRPFSPMAPGAAPPRSSSPHASSRSSSQSPVEPSVGPYIDAEFRREDRPR